jgi:hypothetical protein
MILLLFQVLSGRKIPLNLRHLLTVIYIFKNILDLLQKDPSKRMTIKEVLEHPWIQKFNKTKLPEMRRQSKDDKASNFKIYTTTDETHEK